MNVDPKRVCVLDYTNYRGERSLRRVQPLGGLAWSASPEHEEPQWLLECWDLDKQAHRTYAMADIHSWRIACPSCLGTGKGVETKPAFTTRKDCRVCDGKRYLGEPMVLR